MGILDLLYILTISLLMLHEIDSTFWKEWVLFRLPGGYNSFLWLHLPLFILAFLGFYGLIEKLRYGYTTSLIFSFTGIFAFLIHNILIMKGNPEFRTKSSQIILVLLLLSSVGQLIMTLKIM